jgi:tRNA-binding EMAP/Myf-like protein
MPACSECGSADLDATEEGTFCVECGAEQSGLFLCRVAVCVFACSPACFASYSRSCDLCMARAAGSPPPASDKYTGYVVGVVTECGAVPNSSTLKKLAVDVGASDGKPLQIVTNAKHAAVGSRVVAAQAPRCSRVVPPI